MSDPDQADAVSAARTPVFATTHWSVVMQAGDGYSSESKAALEKLCRTYWFPLFTFLRRKGHAQEKMPRTSRNI